MTAVIVSYVFFVFLGGLAVFVFVPWLRECRNFPGYYREAMPDNVSQDTACSLQAILEPAMSLMIGSLNIILGGILIIVFGYISLMGVFINTYSLLFM